MSKKHLITSSHRIDSSKWWYETNSGIEVHVDTVKKHHVFNISWIALRNALARKDKA